MNPIQSFKRLFAVKKEVRNKKRNSKLLIKQPVDRVRMQIDTLSQAVEIALDPLNSDRIDLLTIFENAWKDSQVISEREKAEAYITTEPFEVRTGGVYNEEKTKLLRRPWFDHYSVIVAFIEFWGYTLAEFQAVDENGEFTDVIVFPRKFVRPYEKMIVAEPTNREGVTYEGFENDFFIIPLGDPDVIGKLESISREVIWKNFARSDWSEFNERYNKPFVDYAVDTDNEEELKAKEEMAANFGSFGYMIRDKDEIVNIIHNASRASSENFKDFADFCDEQISKLMNGQTGTSDEKAFVGSAEVHERVLETFTEARLKRIQSNVNYTLLPFLTYHGYPFTSDDEFLYPVLEENEKKKSGSGAPEKPEKPEHPEDDPEEPDASASGKKKRDPLSFLGFEYAGGIVLPLAALKGKKEISFNPDKITKAIQRVFNSKRPTDFPRELWEHDFSQMDKSLKDAYGKAGVRFGTPDWLVLQNLRYNTAVFDAFKSNKQIKEAWRLLTWDDGTPRPWREFKRDALRIAEKYNERWLQTEFNDAHTSAYQAAKWQEYVKDRDLYPNLRYVAVMDERTRASHAELNGYVVPIDHPFWKTYYPPNDHGCRCSVQPTDAPVKLPPGELPLVPKKFQNNAGISAQIWNESHPYYSGMTEKEKDRMYYFVRQNIRPADEVIKAFDAFEKKTDAWIKEYFNGDTGGWMAIHTARNKRSWISKNEQMKFTKEKSMCRVFASSGDHLVMLPETPGVSSSDVLRNNIPADLKRASSHNNIYKYAKKAKYAQGAKELLLQLDVMDDKVRKELARVKKKGIPVRYFITGKESEIHTL